MKILVIGNSPRENESIEGILKKISPKAIISYFSTSKEIIQYIEDNMIDVCIIDYDCINYAYKLKERNSKINLIFINKNKSYQKDALELKASAYLFKPLDQETLSKELDELRHPIKEHVKLLKVQCFGNFSVFKPNGEIVKFSRRKSRELLAYLVYKCGSDVSTKELGAILFEDQEYDNKQMSYLHQILHSLVTDLKEIGAQDVLVRKYNSTSVDIDKIDCDYYRFNKNDKLAKRLYNGEFMMQYEWADYVTAYLDRNVENL